MPVISRNSLSLQAGIGLIELMIALLLFSICVVSLTQLQLKAGMEGLDNHQRSVALWSARALVDRISANSSQEAISEYETRLSAITDCTAVVTKRCEAASSDANVASCSPAELASYDVWSTFCDGENSLSALLIDYSAEFSCEAGPCTPSSNMTLRLSWVSRVSDSDTRLSASTPDSKKGERPSNLDFITLDFRP